VSLSSRSRSNLGRRSCSPNPPFYQGSTGAPLHRRSTALDLLSLVSPAPSVPHPHSHVMAHSLSTPLHAGPCWSHHRPPHRFPPSERFKPPVSSAPSHRCHCPARAGPQDLVRRSSHRASKLGVPTFSPDHRHWLVVGCIVHAHHEPAPHPCVPHTHHGCHTRGPAQWLVGHASTRPRACWLGPEQAGVAK
jgi:hypothetical protein